jgi:hypothetical protein
MKKNEIIIKDTNVLRGLMERNYAPLLITIICEIIDNFGIRMSESWREKKHPNDLHGTNPVRAIDISEWVYNDGQAQDIEKWINNRWVYDPDRTRMKVAVLHKVRGGVLHFHIQVHQNTIRRAG